MRDRNLWIYYKNYNQFIGELGQDKVSCSLFVVVILISSDLKQIKNDESRLKCKDDPTTHQQKSQSDYSHH